MTKRLLRGAVAVGIVCGFPALFAYGWFLGWLTETHPSALIAAVGIPLAVCVVLVYRYVASELIP